MFENRKLLILQIVIIQINKFQLFSERYNAKCRDDETGRELYIGEFFTRPGQCVRVQCLGNLQLWEDR